MTDAERIVRALHLWNTYLGYWDEETEEVQADAKKIRDYYEEHKGKMGFTEAGREAKIVYVASVLERREGIKL